MTTHYCPEELAGFLNTMKKEVLIDLVWLLAIRMDGNESEIGALTLIREEMQAVKASRVK